MELRPAADARSLRKRRPNQPVPEEMRRLAGEAPRFQRKRKRG
jgi:hypothetical protein